jgi:hypothetical protein
VLVKVAYAPGWRAEDEAGRALPIVEAAPHLMLVFAHGNVTLRYQPTKVALLLRWGALAALLVAVALLAISRLHIRRS